MPRSGATWCGRSRRTWPSVTGAIDVAIHRPHREGDTRNHHAHLLATTRVVTDAGLGSKTSIEWKDADRTKRGLESGRVEVTAIRSRWAAIVNEHLAEHGHAARIDHRSLDAQGIDREPTYHKGPAVTAIERRGEEARIVERMREDVGERLQSRGRTRTPGARVERARALDRRRHRRSGVWRSPPATSSARRHTRNPYSHSHRRSPTFAAMPERSGWR